MILELHVKENGKKSYKSKELVIVLGRINIFLYFTKNQYSDGECTKKELAN